MTRRARHVGAGAGSGCRGGHREHERPLADSVGLDVVVAPQSLDQLVLVERQRDRVAVRLLEQLLEVTPLQRDVERVCFDVRLFAAEPLHIQGELDGSMSRLERLLEFRARKRRRDAVAVAADRRGVDELGCVVTHARTPRVRFAALAALVNGRCRPNRSSHPFVRSATTSCRKGAEPLLNGGTTAF